MTIQVPVEPIRARKLTISELQRTMLMIALGDPGLKFRYRSLQNFGYSKASISRSTSRLQRAGIIVKIRAIAAGRITRFGIAEIYRRHVSAQTLAQWIIPLVRAQSYYASIRPREDAEIEFREQRRRKSKRVKVVPDTSRLSVET